MSTADHTGCRLLQERLASVPTLLAAWLPSLSAPLERAAFKDAHFVITGIGSSEAHGRYLHSLLWRRRAGSAEFRPLSSFLGPPNSADKEKVLVVISQGLSPNAWLALNARHSFRRLVVLTAATVEGMRSEKGDAAAEKLQKLEAESTVFVRFPVENEYQVLLRVVGPFFGYLACHHFARLYAEANLAPLSLDDLQSAAARAAQRGAAAAPSFGEACARGFALAAAAPLSLYAQNCALKFLEGVFWRKPELYDLLDLSHGPVQQWAVEPRPVVFLTVEGEHAALLDASRRLLDDNKLPRIELSAELPLPLAIVELELLFSHLVTALIERTNIDQRNWPAKGLDQALYALGK